MAGWSDTENYGFLGEFGQSQETPEDSQLDEVFTEDLWNLENAKPFQFKKNIGVREPWYISSANGTIKPLPLSDWSASTAAISFTAWMPVQMTDDSIDIWSPTLRKAIREACPDIYDRKSDTMLSLDKILRNYDRLDQYIRDKQLQASSNDQVLQELKLFAYAFIQSADIARYLGTFGFEKLYEEKVLSLSYWEDLQQLAFERDLDLLEKAFDAAEEEGTEEKITRDEEAINEIIEGAFACNSSPEATDVKVCHDDLYYAFGGSRPPTEEEAGDHDAWEGEVTHFKLISLLEAMALPTRTSEQDLVKFLEDRNISCSLCKIFLCDIRPLSTSFRLMTPDEEQRYQRRVSLENAEKVLEAVSNNADDLAARYLADNGYSGFKERFVELALRQGDFDAVRFLQSVEFPMREAVSMGDLGLVQRLVSYEVDPNDGPHFMERPFQTAIMTGKLEIARYLLCRCNVTDLGSLRAPLYMALRRGRLEEARSLLNAPRTLTAYDVNGLSAATMMQSLREKLKIEHESFLTASLNLNASLGFRTLGDHLKDRRTIWKMGISAMRRLRKDRAPSDFRQVISLLLVASSMRKTTSIEEFGDYHAFLLDLRRWRVLAVEDSRRDLFDELVLSLWGQEMQPLDGQCEDFGKDMDFLRAFAREFAEIAESPPATDNTAVDEMSGTHYEGGNPAFDGASKLPEPEAQTNDKDPVPVPELQNESRCCTVATYLRLGAIFCFFIAGLLVFQGYCLRGNALQYPGRFSSLIDAFYVAPMQLESPSWIKFPSFVEEARIQIQDGRIRTVAELDSFMYYKALSSMPLNEVWDQSLMRKVIESGSVLLKSALKRWTMQKSLTYLAVYHGLQPTFSSLSGCIKSNPTSSIAMDLHLLSSSIRVAHHIRGVILTPISMQTPSTFKSPYVTPGGSGEMDQNVSTAQTTPDDEVSFSSPVADRLLSSPKPLQHLRPLSITRPRKNNNRVQKWPGPEDKRTCHKCGKVLATVTNKNRHVVDKHPESPGQESATGSPAGATVRIFHFCRFQCGARYTQARNCKDHERKVCKLRGDGVDAGHVDI